MKTMFRKLILALVLAYAPCSAIAAPLALDVEGNIGHANNADRTAWHLTEADLLKLPAHSITTSTTWTPKSTFTGPLLSDVLALADARGDRCELHTLDDYSHTVPVAQAVKYGAILAYSMNGKRLKVSDFGPLFLIYPRDAYPSEFTGAGADAQFVWQVKALVIR